MRFSRTAECGNANPGPAARSAAAPELHADRPVFSSHERVCRRSIVGDLLCGRPIIASDATSAAAAVTWLDTARSGSACRPDGNGSVLLVEIQQLDGHVERAAQTSTLRDHTATVARLLTIGPRAEPPSTSPRRCRFGKYAGVNARLDDARTWGFRCRPRFRPVRDHLAVLAGAGVFDGAQRVGDVMVSRRTSRLRPVVHVRARRVGGSGSRRRTRRSWRGTRRAGPHTQTPPGAELRTAYAGLTAARQEAWPREAFNSVWNGIARTGFFPDPEPSVDDAVWRDDGSVITPSRSSSMCARTRHGVWNTSQS